MPFSLINLFPSHNILKRKNAAMVKRERKRERERQTERERGERDRNK